MISIKQSLGLAFAGAMLVTATQPSVSFAQTASPVVNQSHNLSVARYLGGVGKNEARAIGYLANGDVVAGGNFASSVAGVSGGAGKILLLSADGKTIKKAITLGARIDSLQTRGNSTVVGGDFGVAVLDGSLNVVWKNPLTGLAAGNGKSDGGQTRVAIEPSGRVAALRDKNVTLFSATGAKISSTKIDRTYVNDVAIDPYGRRVYVVGYSNRTRNGVPVQVSFLMALNSEDNLKELWKTWDFPAIDLGNDMADSRLYRVAVGGDGFVTVSGESAGGNSIYRWNGKNLTTRTQVRTDKYNDAYNTASNHILYIGKVKADTGEVANGTFTLTRLANNKGNTIRAKDGGLAVDSQGRVYVGADAAFGIANRDLNKINGQTVSPYTPYEMYLLVLSADLKQRIRWTPFSGAPKGNGVLNALAVDKNGRIGILGTVYSGNMITTDNNQRFNSADGTVTDAYFSILKP